MLNENKEGRPASHTANPTQTTDQTRGAPSHSPSQPTKGSSNQIAVAQTISTTSRNTAVITTWLKGSEDSATGNDTNNRLKPRSPSRLVPSRATENIITPATIATSVSINTTARIERFKWVWAVV